MSQGGEQGSGWMLLGMGWPGEGLLAGKGEPQKAHSFSLAAHCGCPTGCSYKGGTQASSHASFHSEPSGAPYCLETRDQIAGPMFGPLQASPT